MRILLLSLCLLTSLTLVAQEQNIWSQIDDTQLKAAPYHRDIVPETYATFELQFAGLKKQLAKAPKRFSAEARGVLPAIQFPMPSGEIETFEMVETEVMHPNLAARYSGIKSYVGKSKDNPQNVIYAGYSHKGFHGVIFSPDMSTVYIDVYAREMVDTYIVYHRKDLVNTHTWSCGVEDSEVSSEITKQNTTTSQKLAGDCQFRTFELALACTGEYAQFHGGTVPDVMAAFVTSLVRLNGIYERDVNLTMVLIENNDDLIFLDANTDPYTNQNGGAMLGENQTTIDNIIGFDNYDIGHVYSTGGGGVAFLRSPCNGNKAGGVTGLGNPIGDTFWVDFVAHEMGHQYGGNHTQNNNCQRSGASVEPGSASTIMGYAGICVPNVQNNSDDHFHAFNLGEFAAFFAGNGGTCPDTESTGNTAPTIEVEQASYVVPVSTPLILTAAAEDADADDVVTYGWEQMDSEVGEVMPPEPTNSQGPAFRSNSPTTSPTRYLPNLQTIIDNTNSLWEVLPSVSRDMSWRCTVRDNSPLIGGCTAEVDVELEFSEAAGPFLVQTPNTSDVEWRLGGTGIVEWDVANTDASPVNTSSVDIYLSVDGGQTYPHLLITDVPNDGSQEVVVPNQLTDQARVMVRGNGNIFFDISNENFSILEPLTATFSLSVDPLIQVGCPDQDVNYSISLQSFLDFEEDVNFSLEGAPAELSVAYQASTTSSTEDNVLTIQGTELVDAGTYVFTVVAQSPSVLREQEIELIILPTVLPTSLNTPGNGELGVASFGTALEWNISGGEEEFVVELSTDPGFNSIIASATTVETILNLDALEAGTVYYWRVRGQNQCEQGEFSETFAFQTGKGEDCVTYNSEDNLPLPLPPNQVSLLELEEGLMGDFIKVNFEMTHTWVGDMAGNLIDPDGNSIPLFDQPGIENSQFGCDGDNMIVSLFDAAESTAEDLANTCAGTVPTISGDFQPLGSLGDYADRDLGGTWSLELLDLFPTEDDGSLESWSIEVCNFLVSGDVSVTRNDVLFVPIGASEFITNVVLETSGEASGIRYAITSLPSKGSLQLDGTELALGSAFTQSDINNGVLSYLHSGVDTDPDNFTFDIVDDQDNWLRDGVQEINIISNDIIAAARIDRDASCAGGADGQFTVNVEGGNAPFVYILDGTEQESPIFQNLPAGTYEVTVRDRLNFEAEVTGIVIGEPSEIIMDLATELNTITVLADGGTDPYMYAINGGDPQSSNVFSSLSNGDYEVTVTDANGCSITMSTSISIDGLQADATQINELRCFGDSDATVEIDASEGFPPYEYRIVGGQPWQDSDVFEGLEARGYTFRVRDSEGNIINIPLTIEQPDAITATTSADLDNISVNADGGTGDLMYSINGGNPQSDGEFSNLENGDYEITIMDENGCTLTVNESVSVDDLALTGLLAGRVSCFGESDAMITLSADGGIPPYRYRLLGSGGFQDSPEFDGLPAGTYTFRVRDDRGDIIDLEFLIEGPDEIIVTTEVENNQVTITASGGTGSYTYNVGGDDQTDEVFTDLDNGNFTATVTDSDGCVGTAIFQIDVEALEGSVTITQEILCNGNLATLEVSAVGGVQPYQYSVDGVNFSDSPVFADLTSGTYMITIRDAIGQTLQLTDEIITSPDSVGFIASVDASTITVEASGGTAPYRYSIDGINFQDSGVFENLPNGEYEIIAVDSNGCMVSGMLLINVFFDYIVTTTDLTCFESADGTITFEITEGGVPPFIYIVDGVEYDVPTIEGLVAGVHEVSVIDATGLTVGPGTLTINQPDEITITTDLQGNDLLVSAQGGSGTYQYSIDGVNFQLSGNFPNLAAGDYMVVVRDDEGCISTEQVIFSISNVEDIDDSKIAFDVYPNPSSGNMIVNLTNLELIGDVQIRIVNPLGQDVYRQLFEVGSTQYQLDVTQIPDGQYLLQVVNGDQVGVKNIVILH